MLLKSSITMLLSINIQYTYTASIVNFTNCIDDFLLHKQFLQCATRKGTCLANVEEQLEWLL